MSLDFTPKTRLEKILCGLQSVVAKTRLEKAVKYAVNNAGSGGSGDVFVVHGSYAYDEQADHDLISIDKTTSEIYEAAEAGKAVILLVNEDDSYSEWILTDSGEGKDDDIHADFVMVDTSKDGATVSRIVFHSDGSGQEPEVFELATEEDADFAPFRASAVMTLDGNNKKVMTLSYNGNPLKASDAYELVKNGKQCIMSFEVNGANVECVMNINAIKFDDLSTVSYSFRVDTDTTYKVGSLGADDQVVITEV